MTENTKVAPAAASPYSMEERALFNPAFLGLLIRQTAKGHQAVQGVGVHMALAFVGASLVLHKSTRETLPPTIRTDLSHWLTNNARIRAQTPSRVEQLSPLLRSALAFSAIRNVIRLDGDRIVEGPLRIPAAHLKRVPGEAGVCLNRAQYVGRWIARSGPTKYQLSLWGVSP